MPESALHWKNLLSIEKLAQVALGKCPRYPPRVRENYYVGTIMQADG